MSGGDEAPPPDIKSISLPDEWEDNRFELLNKNDPSLTENFSLEHEILNGPGGAPADIRPDYHKFVDDFRDHLDDDIGFAVEAESINILARMSTEDKPSFMRAEEVLRSKKLLKGVRKEIQQETMSLKKLSVISGGPESEASPDGLVLTFFPDAPVSDVDCVPPPWGMVSSMVRLDGWLMYKMVVRKQNGIDMPSMVPFSRQPIVVSEVLEDIGGGSDHMRVAWRHTRGWSSKVVAQVDTGQNTDLVKALGGERRSPISSANARDIVAYLSDYRLANQDTIPTQKMTTQMGWQGKDRKYGFVFGREHIKADDNGPTVQFVGDGEGEQQMERCFSKKGTAEGWAKAAKIASKYPSVEFAIYASLSPPLLDILDAPNFVVDWSYKTSSGKTTTLGLAASCWGDPRADGGDSLITSWDTTAVGFERRAAAMSHLPLIVDDTKRARSFGGRSSVPEMVYEVTNGKGRGRGAVKGTQRSYYWRTVMLSTGEQRLIDFDKSGGTVARVVTLWGCPFGETSIEAARDIEKINGLLAEHHGHSGRALVEWIVANSGKYSDVRGMYKELVVEIRTELLAMDPEADPGVVGRISEYLGVPCVASMIIHETMDLPWELKDPVRSLLAQVGSAARAVNRAKEAMVAAVEWANANAKKFCYNQKNRSEEEPHGGWLGFWELNQDDGWDKLAFEKGPLKDFLKRAGFDDPLGIMRQWKEAGWLKTEGKRKDARVEELEGRPFMVVVPRDTVAKVAGLGEPEEARQEPLPF